jgi:hypothetical protein
MYWLWVLVCLLGSLSVVEAACTTEQLANEITTDPLSLGYATYVTAKNDAALLALLTEIRAGEDYVVSKGVVSMEAEMGTWGDVIFLVRDHPMQATRDRWIGAINDLFISRRTLDYSNATVVGFFARMVQDQLRKGDGSQLLTLDDVTARTTRQGSRAEVVCGSAPADRVTLNAVACASHGHMCQ